MPPPPPPTQIGFIGATPGASTTIITTQQPSYGSIPVVVQPVQGADVIVVGGCPACRVSVESCLVQMLSEFWFLILLVR